MTWDVVIGLEVHVQLNTESKLFSNSATNFGASANTQASFIDLALPGVLPVLNKEAVSKAMRFGLAVGGKINQASYFERKNYFYPDLPKGYQTSQLQSPIIEGGEVLIETENGTKAIQLTRAHLEEDAGKSIHLADGSGIDLNRAGVPLLEIVTEPVIRSAEEAVSYLKTLNHLVRYIGISDGNMQEGSFRADVNLSLKPEGSETLGTRVEIKNLNSYRFIDKAIAHEIDRHMDLLESGQSISQETRLFDEGKGITKSMRSKEDANDYRYFPCPDLLPIQIDDEQIEAAKNELGELPQSRYQRYQQAYQFNVDDLAFLTATKAMGDYFEETVKATSAKAKIVLNWLKGEVSAKLNQDRLLIHESLVPAEALAELLDCLAQDTVSGHVAKQVFEDMWQTGKSANAIIKEKGLADNQDTDALDALIVQVISENPKQVEQYQAGQDKLLGFFVGQVMKLSQGKGNPKVINQRLREKLKS